MQDDNGDEKENAQTEQKPQPQPVKKPDDPGQTPSNPATEGETGPSKSSGTGPHTIDPDNEFGQAESESDRKARLNEERRKREEEDD